VSSLVVTWQRFLTMPASRLKFSLNGGSLQIILVSIVLLITPVHRPSKNTFSNSTPIVACISVAAGTCLPSRCIETALHATILNSVDSFCSSKYSVFQCRTFKTKRLMTIGLTYRFCLVWVCDLLSLLSLLSLSPSLQRQKTLWIRDVW
jgi:hypothetical protein